jgi:tight adherence protein C
MELFIALAIFLAVAVAVFAFGAGLFAPASPLRSRLRALLSTQEPQRNDRVNEKLESIMEPLSRVAPVSEKTIAGVSKMLVQAGYRAPQHVTIFLGLRIFSAAALAGLAFLFDPSDALFFAPIALALGLVLPTFILKAMINSRKRAITLALADALDLAVICVEAGLGINQAFHRIALELAHTHPALADEFRLMQLEMNAGKERREALQNLAMRTDVDDVKSFVAVLTQTDRFGTSIAQALRVQSDSLRTERRQRAEEAAAKTTIKMIPVLVIFVFPALFVVTLGPVAINIVRQLLPALSDQ